MNEHTKEPWFYEEVHEAEEFWCERGYIEAGPALLLGIADECQANARRIVACVNACAGVSTQFLESIGESGLDNPADAWIRGSQQIRAVEQQRDKLLAALNELLSFDLETDGETSEWPELVTAVINARALINDLMR